MKSDGHMYAALATILLLVVIAAIWNNYVYGDWTCMFSHCVRIK